MQLKKSIQLLVYGNRIFIGVLLICVVILVAKSGEGKLLVLEALILIPFGLSVLFRKIIASKMLRKSNYPGVFFDVLQKMGMTQDLELSITDELLEEIYNPNYSTSQFLNDNNLRTEVKPAKLNITLLALILTLPAASILYIAYSKGFGRSTLFLAVSFVLPIIIAAIKRRKNQPEIQEEKLVVFREKELDLQHQRIAWTRIYDWSSVNTNDDKGGTAIVINYYGPDKNIEEAFVSLATTDTSKIDFLMLMTHFKGKYGKL
jgi:hypothetical protein